MTPNNPRKDWKAYKFCEPVHLEGRMPDPDHDRSPGTRVMPMLAVCQVLTVVLKFSTL